MTQTRREMDRDSNRQGEGKINERTTKRHGRIDRKTDRKKNTGIEE